MGQRSIARAVSTAMSLALVAACTGGGPAALTPAAVPPTTTNSPSPTPTPTDSAPPYGGDVKFGAEGWPDCLNPITECADNAWTYYTVLEQVLPRAMQLDPKGNFVASPLLVEAPSLVNGDLTESPFTVTYKIRPEAVWEDGSPITSADLEFTWRAILGTPGAIRIAGYQEIESIDTSDPSAAVIRFKNTYADWPDLFGGAFGFILKQAAFPQTANSAPPDLAADMQTSIPFSGGPFKLQAWSKQKASLVRNDNYFSKVPNLDSVTFVPVRSSADELMALFTGQVSAMYVEPPALRLLDGVYGFVSLKAIGSRGTDYEALRFDLSRRPLDDPKVREALMYAIDRQVIIDELIEYADPDTGVLNCGFVALPGGQWCSTDPFAAFIYNPKKAKSILENDGYDCTVTPCTKNGVALKIGYDTSARSFFRTQVRALLIPKALEAGFELRAPTSDLLPAIHEFPVRTSPDPTVTSLLGCEAVPTESSGETGENITHWCNMAADLLMKQSDEALDPAKRLQLLNLVYSLEAADFIGLPLFVTPKAGAWQTNDIDGPIAAYAFSGYGLFFNMNEWYVPVAH